MSRAVLTAWSLAFLLIAGSLHHLSAQSSKKYWVWFTDKGNGIPASGKLSRNLTAYQTALEILSTKALQRRAKVLPQESLIDAADVPLFQFYIKQIEQAGGVLHQQSRWFNAASFSLTSNNIEAVSQFSFVKEITPVVVFKGKPLPQDNERTSFSLSNTTSFDYGPSLAQVDAVNVLPLHQMGVTGNNVRVGMLDSGFRWKIHEALQGRKVIGEYDFIFHDSVTSNESGDASNQDGHGTYTLSTLGGFKEGKLIGPAFDAEFLLAKTEYIPTETQIEEDIWAAGIEWLEANGADVVSSSVGYNAFDGGGGYLWENGDFNGRTTITARAALRAARLGVLVCNSMGNEGNGDGVSGTMLTPADADSILSVGAISVDKYLAYFSSTGPTNDGRIKPDIVAPGMFIYCARPGMNTYTTQQGTSLSAPLAAGSAALILSARPELTPIQVRDALRNTADTTNNSNFHQFPNNFLGWGSVNAFNAALSFGPIFSNEPNISNYGTSNTISTIVVSKFGIKPDSVLLHYNIEGGAFTSIQMQFDSTMFFPSSGRYIVTLSPIAVNSRVQFYIESSDSGGNSYQSPAPSLNKKWQFCCGTTEVWSGSEIPRQATLLQNFPNPFNSSTTITFETERCEPVDVAVYSLTGQKVKILYNATSQPSAMSFRWNGDDDRNSSVASGVYFVRVTTPTFSSTKTMLLLR
ncbi:MAG: S8 family peptidase [Ignavibacteriae bacterium]|nr:S8 family peptidase [Ignavibacteriota bacterium]